MDVGPDLRAACRPGFERYSDRVEIAAGAFALAGVLLGGLLAELRAWREARSKRESDLLVVRRETYLRALVALETVASRYNQWVAQGKPQDEVWNAIAAAYVVLNEARLITSQLDALNLAFEDLIRVYRNQIEANDRVRVSAKEQRDHLVEVLRRDISV